MQGFKLHTLDTISLADFIDLYLGDDSKAVAEGNAPEDKRREAAMSIKLDYIRIIGGKTVAAQIMRADAELKLKMRATVLGAAKALAEAGDMESSRNVMRTLGYELADDQLLRKIDALRATDRMKEDRLTAQPVKTAEVSRETFTRDRVALMRHTGMYIDTNKMRASEYAWMLKSMCDELDAAVRNSKKNKR